MVGLDKSRPSPDDCRADLIFEQRGVLVGGVGQNRKIRGWIELKEVERDFFQGATCGVPTDSTASRKANTRPRFGCWSAASPSGFAPVFCASVNFFESLFASFRFKRTYLRLASLQTMRSTSQNLISTLGNSVLSWSSSSAEIGFSVTVLVSNTNAISFWRVVGYAEYSLDLEILPKSSWYAVSLAWAVNGSHSRSKTLHFKGVGAVVAGWIRAPKVESQEIQRVWP